VIATYRVKGPGGNWKHGGNGAYHVYLNANQVADANFQSAASSVLGLFKVAIK
jgi:hypothetical protein